MRVSHSQRTRTPTCKLLIPYPGYSITEISLPKPYKAKFSTFITNMDAPTSLDIRPATTPHLDIDHLSLADKDFQFKDTVTQENLLRIHWWAKDRFLNHADDIHLWDSNLPKYTFPEIHLFPDIVHFCHACYIPSQRAIIAPNQDFLFSITAESINQMLQI